MPSPEPCTCYGSVCGNNAEEWQSGSWHSGARPQRRSLSPCAFSEISLFQLETLSLHSLEVRAPKWQGKQNWEQHYIAATTVMVIVRVIPLTGHLY